MGFEPPAGVQGDPASAASVAASRDGIWVAAEEGRLQRLDPAGKKVISSIETGNNPSSLAVGAGAVWASDGLGNTVARIDPARNLVIATTRVGNGPASVATSAEAVWVAERLDDAVARINPETNSVTTTIPVGRSPTGIAVGFGSVWVANSLDGTVSRIDPARNRVTATIPVGGSPTAISVGNGRVWVSVRTALVAASSKRGDVVRVASTPIDYARPRNRRQPRLLAARVRDLRGIAQLPGSAGAGRISARPGSSGGMPTRSADGKSYTFTVRPGFRFSPPSNAPVTAQTFKYAIERALSPKVEDGPATKLRRRHRRRTGLRDREGEAHLRHQRPPQRPHRPADGRRPGLPGTASLIYFCPVPLGTPVDPQGRTRCHRRGRTTSPRTCPTRERC